MKILLLGSNSMAGHIIMQYLLGQNTYEVHGIPEENFSIISFFNKIKKLKPNVVINTLRILVEASTEDPKKALFINSYLPKVMEKMLINSKIKIIHLSSDCVFSGNEGNYSEPNVPDGDSVYSISKFCGEIVNEKDLTIRASYVGPTNREVEEELFDWVLRQSGIIQGYENALWNGITTLELAKQIHKAIISNICGLYHLCSNEKISKYELLLLIKKYWRLKSIKIEKFSSKKIDRSLLDNRKILSVKSYDEMFSELYQYMIINKSSYEHYNRQ